MIEIKGKYNRAICYADDLEKTARDQIVTLCDLEIFSDSKICIMPDVHAGAGCTIGTTMTITDIVVPNMVGVDIGCGIETVKIENESIDFDELDYLIRSEIPSGRDIRKTPHENIKEIDLSMLKCKDNVDLHRGRLSIGTLGGGNHFIEVGKDKEEKIYIAVHSGSRNIGFQVARYYQNAGFKVLKNKIKSYSKLKTKSSKKKVLSNIPKDLAFVEGELFHDYLNDMGIMQKYADINRRAIMDIIIEKMKLKPVDRFSTIHNYIDIENMILRKGAVSANLNEKFLVPINMRDGSLVCIGKGNKDWNYSAPHGAGRVLSRTQACKSLNLKEYKSEMSSVYSTTVGQDTLDEAPMAYKSMEYISRMIEPTAEIIDRIVPVYNFKAAE
jgi:tRNA-splicing ligase RtcB